MPYETLNLAYSRGLSISDYQNQQHEIVAGGIVGQPLGGLSGSLNRVAFGRVGRCRRRSPAARRGDRRGRSSVSSVRIRTVASTRAWPLTLT